MKKLPLVLLFCFIVSAGFSQGKLISYEEVQFMLQNNLNRSDSLLIGKGYTQTEKNEKKRTRLYTLNTPRNTFVKLLMRADGRRIFLELETNDIQQHDVITSSITQYPHKIETIGDVLVYNIKNLGNVYITSTDMKPYDPLKKNYLMQIAPDKNVMAFD